MALSVYNKEVLRLRSTGVVRTESVGVGWGGGKAASGFGADGFRTLVSMATDSSHRVI